MNPKLRKKPVLLVPKTTWGVSILVFSLSCLVKQPKVLVTMVWTKLRARATKVSPVFMSMVCLRSKTLTPLTRLLFLSRKKNMVKLVPSCPTVKWKPLFVGKLATRTPKPHPVKTPPPISGPVPHKKSLRPRGPATPPHPGIDTLPRVTYMWCPAFKAPPLGTPLHVSWRNNSKGGNNNGKRSPNEVVFRGWCLSWLLNKKTEL